ncbi:MULTISPECIES: HupE/UreJ family protein [Halobacteriovorax]|uniref:HupE/UreJ family protein n=1 Tax=Halobacteriovorax vibrionivorans TaxID=2152716 RepID=A0ABY0IFB5_9BACT|nr:MULTISPECIES: HupE/UreJ family protein [Halobacteriovorax]AYF43825.1 membrane protein [Halobacteriovorax sp. BALOs_7]RZF21641.1 HupE/UreJ family protein [Halobacteriovorax vibrionivorans]TGD49066.1 HupE/UreJ family protein [Halobacteriovorax sp. Y22]
MSKLIRGFVPLLFSANLFAHGISEEAKQAMIDGGLLRYVWLGAEHMITGYDHLLFLFGVIFFLKTFKDIVRFISIFTLGHSITLIFATFMGITANYWLVDAVIAISVIYKGFDNNKGFQEYFGMNKSPSLLWMVFIFGLIHGFGLSTRLQQLPLGEKGSGMLMRIISFNIGVELGQIVALAIMLLIITQLRRHHMFKRLSRVFNDGIMLAGFMLLLMQLHGYLHTSGPDEFGFSEDNHMHHHMKLENEQEYQHDNL